MNPEILAILIILGLVGGLTYLVDAVFDVFDGIGPFKKTATTKETQSCLHINVMPRWIEDLGRDIYECTDCGQEWHPLPSETCNHQRLSQTSWNEVICSVCTKLRP